ncbi:MAG: hypothetical protein FJ290_18250 [Planctomycetes bacterium]|nr:hypothetical protein [Planctomycetota bacterium]
MQNRPETPPAAGLCPSCRAARDGTGQATAYLDALAGELQDRLEHQRAVLRTLLGQHGPTAPAAARCPLAADCHRLKDLRGLLRETIAVIEATRGAFKCQRLEVMRKKLTDSLAGG